MKTVVLGPRPGELQALIERRQRLGIDLFDEVWEGSYHVAPAAHPSHGYVDKQLAVLLAPYATAAGLIGTGPFNLGEPDDYRVPDGGYHRSLPTAVWVPTVAVVVEVVSPMTRPTRSSGSTPTTMSTSSSSPTRPPVPPAAGNVTPVATPRLLQAGCSSSARTR